MTTYEGGCHCGTVRFKVVLPRPIPFLTDCDCSICTKKGVLHCPAEVEQFTLTDGEGTLRLYQFHSETAKHWFCERCGIHVYGRPRNHPHRLTVNARCFDRFDDVKLTAEIRDFDGKNHPRDQSQGQSQ